MSHFAPWFLIIFLLVWAPAHGQTVESRLPDSTSNYMPAIRQELSRLDIAARCDDITATCVCSKDVIPGAPALDLVLQYSAKTNTIYFYIDKFLPLRGPEGPSLELARQLLALNREMVTGKFEWDKNSVSIRLATTMNTDSNFDRRAFRSQILGLWSIAKRVLPTLQGLTQARVSKTEPTAP